MASPLDEFHRLYYDSEVWLNTTWRGVHTLKCPLDLWLYQEIIVRTRPDLIIECGTFNGGSALFLADMCELVGNGSVVTIDVQPQPQLPSHERITYLTGSSIAPEMLATVSARICGRTMVILDSNHAASHVYAELLLWSTVVTEGCYLIVEDTNLSGHPVTAVDGQGGPWSAVQRFIHEQPQFAPDKDCHKFHLTFNPFGYLLRKRE